MYNIIVCLKIQKKKKKTIRKKEGLVYFLLS
jgi:hypothetical protein